MKMKNKFFYNIAIVVFLGLFDCFFSRGAKILPVGGIDNDEINPFNAFMNIDRMAEDLMNEMKEENIKLDQLVQKNGAALGGLKPKKASKKGSLHIEEKRNKDGLQRKVVRDLGNGVKSVEITQVYNKKPKEQGMQIEDILDPFTMPNNGFPGMQIGVPTIIIRKNLKKNRGSPRINPINLFTELDNIFESFFDGIAESIVQENEAKIKNKKNKEGKIDDDHIVFDEIDLSLNETEEHANSNHRHSDHEDHIKLNYIKDAKINQEEDLHENELKIEDIDKNKDKDKNADIKKDQHHKLVPVPESTKNSINKIDTREALKEKMVKKRQDQKNNKKMKNPTFVKITKFIFYLICLFSIYIVIRKLMERYGFIINPVEINKSVQTNIKSSISNNDEVPLKQFEISELKQQENKAD